MTITTPSFNAVPAVLNQVKQQLTVDGYLDGCVITMTSGPAKGLSSRILRYEVGTTPASAASGPPDQIWTPVFHVLAFRDSAGNLVTPTDASNLHPTFVINGRPFAGTGFGYKDTGLFVLDAKDGTAPPAPAPREFALLPNPLFFDPTKAGSDYLATTPFGGIGGANDDYTAPDYQHMALAFVTDDPRAPMQLPAVPRLPSYHRPDLVHYWTYRESITLPWDYTTKDLLNQICLRPNPIENPQFTGSNPNMTGPASFSNNIEWQFNLSAPTDPPWDVDNNGDGVPDSVWLDLGAPVQAAPDGRLYKPLFAIMCVDLDGRLNVNTAGTTEQIAVTHTQTITGPYAGTTGATAINLPRGQGYGPAEIDVTQAATGTPFSTADLAHMLRGTGSYEGRYGEGAASTTAEAGQTGSMSTLTDVTRYMYPDNSGGFPPAAPYCAFNSPNPADLWGRSALGLDYTGQPLMWKPAWTNETQNSPYDLDLTKRPNYSTPAATNIDDPFTLGELERVLRTWDVDSAMLPHRLHDISGIQAIGGGSPLVGEIKSRLITTDSWDLPSPSIVAPTWWRNSPGYGSSNPTPHTVAELLTAKLGNTMNFGAWTAVQKTAAIDANVRTLLAPELIAGLRMNINRPLGDGRDNNGNGTVDEPTEALLEGNPSAATMPAGWFWSSVFSGTTWPAGNLFSLTNGMNVTGPDTTSPYPTKVGTKDQVLARQLMARQLYILARLMIDDSWLTSPNNHWFGTETPLLLPAQKKELAIRRIAQWAINAVDAMSSDSSMTPFEYDMDPFSNVDSTGTPKDSNHPERTWCVDGQLGTADDTATWRGLVWGCKPPALVLTETLAFHDRRVADTDKDTSGNERKSPSPDLTLDRIRIPEGSLFVELYAPQNTNNPVQSGDLYTYQKNEVASTLAGSTVNQWFLNLEKMAPAGLDGVNAGPMSYPVWRLAISTATPSLGRPRQFLINLPDSASLEPEQAPGAGNTPSGSLLNTPLGGQSFPVAIERIVWFAGVEPATAPVSGANTHLFNHGAASTTDIFYARKNFNPYILPSGTNPVPAYVPAGGYAIVGPREVTAIGSYKKSAAPNGQWGEASPQRINLNITPATPVITDGTGARDYPTEFDASSPAAPAEIMPPVAIVAAADSPSSWPAGNLANTAKLGTNITIANSTNPYGIGLNISEPLPQGTYYPVPTDNNAYAAFAKWDAYGDLSGGGGTAFPDTPLETSGGSTYPIDGNTATQTNGDVRTVYLQRLADPLSAYNPTTNPYITVDWMPVDLTVFNGDDAMRNHSGYAGQWDPDDANADAAGTLPFSSRERGKHSTNGPTPGPGVNTDGKVWSIAPDPMTVANPPGGENPINSNDNNAGLANINFTHELHSSLTATTHCSSLGYLNHAYGTPINSSDARVGPTPSVGTLPYLGGPPQPMPWLSMNSRPFANPAELMLVPATSPERLLLEVSLADTAATTNPYDPTGATPTNQRAPFSHLLNFFNATDFAGNNALDLANILEYVQTPSPFVGTQTVLNPFTFYWDTFGPNKLAGEYNSVTNSTTPATDHEPTGTAGLHPPFNFVSNYRDPGKVNINTIYNDKIWNSILGGDPSVSAWILGPLYSDLVKSRRGYDVAGGADDYAFDDNSAAPVPRPSIFSNPFRSAAGCDMVPLPGAAAPNLTQKPVNVTLWRAEGTKGGAPDIDNAANKTPLMLNRLTASSNQPYNDWTRNAYFAYQPYGQLVNKLTTRSNVYAVWITVGYFEVTPWYGWDVPNKKPNTSGQQTFDAAHPDGYQLGQEMGSDTGEIKRHRGFYIIDRTIPVGFQRGADLNSDKAVVLKRFIE